MRNKFCLHEMNIKVNEVYKVANIILVRYEYSIREHASIFVLCYRNVMDNLPVGQH
jgi:hypothetical protein